MKQKDLIVVILLAIIFGIGGVILTNSVLGESSRQETIRTVNKVPPELDQDGIEYILDENNIDYGRNVDLNDGIGNDRPLNDPQQ